MYSTVPYWVADSYFCSFILAVYIFSFFLFFFPPKSPTVSEMWWFLLTGSRRASISEVKDSVNNAYQNSVTMPKFSHLSAALCPLPLPLPFPSIFGNLVGQHGELLTDPISGSQSRGSLDIHSIPMAARLRSSSAILPFINRRLGDLRKYGIQQGALGADVVRHWGFQKEDVEDMGETLSKMVMALDPCSQESSDSD